MKVLIVAEGRHELGGALGKLVQRLAAAGVEWEQDRVQRRDIPVHWGKGQGMLKRAIRWMRDAEKRQFDALVLVVDEDGYRDRVREINTAQDDLSVTRLPRALGVAIRSFDAWMLADEKALAQVLGSAVGRQKEPEEDRDPKGTCAGLCGERMSLTDLYAGVAGAVNVGLLEERCPRGFGVFAQRVRGIGWVG